MEKCKVMHVGSSNECFEYDMNGKYLKNVYEERDLGVNVCSSMKASKHVCEAVKKANARVNLIRRNVEYKSAEVVSKLYNAQVRPLLEYCIQFAYPFLQQDIDRLENVQRRATKLIPSIKNFTYRDRLDSLNLFSLKRRRLRGDLIFVYKLLHGLDDLHWSKFFRLSDDCKNVNMQTRGHSFKFLVGFLKAQC